MGRVSSAPFLLQEERHAGRELINSQRSADARKIERLALQKLTEIDAEKKLVSGANLDTAPVVHAEFVTSLPVGCGSTGRNEIAEVPAACSERPDATSFRSGVGEKVIKSLMNSHTALIGATKFEMGTVIVVSEFLPEISPVIHGKPENKVPAVIQRIAGPEILTSQVRNAAAEAELGNLSIGKHRGSGKEQDCCAKTSHLSSL